MIEAKNAEAYVVVWDSFWVRKQGDDPEGASLSGLKAHRRPPARKAQASSPFSFHRRQ